MRKQIKHHIKTYIFINHASRLITLYSVKHVSNFYFNFQKLKLMLD